MNMKNKLKQIDICSILGCLISLSAIMIGIIILGFETEISRDPGGITFGGDFYTEMHGITRSVFISTLRINETLNFSLGCFFIIVGAFGICHFLRSIFNGEKRFKNNTNNISFPNNHSHIKIQHDNQAALSVDKIFDLEQMKQLKELLDIGVITQSEFDAKKKQLLGL